MPRLACAAATLLLVLSGIHPAVAQLRAQPMAAEPVLHALPGSTLTIRGSTTIGARWHCTARDIVAAASLRPGAPHPAADAVASVMVHVPVAALRCQSDAMERSMRRALGADREEASAISGRFAARPPGMDTPAPDTVVRLDGSLSVAAVERPVSLAASVQPHLDGTFRVRSTVPLTLTSFGITPPHALFGLMQARDAITVEVDLRFPRDSTGRDSDEPRS